MFIIYKGQERRPFHLGIAQKIPIWENTPDKLLDQHASHGKSAASGRYGNETRRASGESISTDMASKVQEYTRASFEIDPLDRERVFDAFRRWGYLQAQLDPLGQYLPPQPLPELDLQGEFAEQARRYYCGSIAAEFMHIPDPAKRQWIQDRLETDAPPQDQKRILELLTRADLFEQVIQSRYLGTKRFSLEGVTALIPFLDELLNRAAERSVLQVVLAMSHRGRLNVMVNTIGKSATDIFSKFEDVDPRSVLGGGDVKYHMGATGK